MLKKANWDLTLTLEECRYNYPENLVSIAESQVIRWIDELNKIGNVDEKARKISRQIKDIKSQPRTRESKGLISAKYKELDDAIFLPDYLCVIMEKKADYRRANKGFTVNGIKYRRLLGTNGGIKKSTIVYINETLYPEIKKRIDNGRNMNKELVPAKLEAYQALVCSSSVPVPEPNIVVVNDCITHFKEDVILIDDSCEGEPDLRHVKDYEIERNNSDGCGLMSPAYAQVLNIYLNNLGAPISGVNTRYCWCKGMLGTFDFVEFADKIAKTRIIKDAWGYERDLTNIDVILTTSMVKLWDSYDSWEDYKKNCDENHYEFAVTKDCPNELEFIRYMNYQFLQPYKLTDDELMELCRPSINQIKDILGMDYRKSLLYLCGFGISEEDILRSNYDLIAQALMAEPKMINDPYIRKHIWNMIEKRVNDCKKGSIEINANFAMIYGDLFALCQSIFGIEPTGLLKAGELYHKYWIDKGSDELVCFRAPMTCGNNIRKLKLNKSEEVAHWFRYIKTGIIFNAFDTTCDALNGADFDGDTAMCTDNPILIKNTTNKPTIVCMQRRAAKSIVTEEQIIESNMIAFNDNIGKITNYVTAMIERQAGFEPDSEEYKVLDYRIMCGQNYQQSCIDAAKGIVTKPMPKEWYRTKENIIDENDSISDKKRKELNQKIVAHRKPYFMIYVYSKLKKQYKDYLKNNDDGVKMKYGTRGIYTIHDLKNYSKKDSTMTDILNYYDICYPVGENPCLVNKIARLFENQFDSYLSAKRPHPKFDYSILKSEVEYLPGHFKEIKKLYKEYFARIQTFKSKWNNSRIDKIGSIEDYSKFKEDFSRRAFEICPNAKELCNIVIDLCYKSTKSKQFVWDICGEQIIENLLEHNKHIISFPEKCLDNEEFKYEGFKFRMRRMEVSAFDSSE